MGKVDIQNICNIKKGIVQFILMTEKMIIHFRYQKVH